MININRNIYIDKSIIILLNLSGLNFNDEKKENRVIALRLRSPIES